MKSRHNIHKILVHSVGGSRLWVEQPWHRSLIHPYTSIFSPLVPVVDLIFQVSFCEVSPLRVTPLQAPGLMPDRCALLINIKMITNAGYVVRDYLINNLNKQACQ